MALVVRRRRAATTKAWTWCSEDGVRRQPRQPWTRCSEVVDGQMHCSVMGRQAAEEVVRKGKPKCGVELWGEVAGAVAREDK
jgi:hypothetical protein